MPVLTVREVAEQAHITQERVQRLIREGKIPTVYRLSARKTGYLINTDVLKGLGDLSPNRERKHVKPKRHIVSSGALIFIAKCFTNKSWWE